MVSVYDVVSLTKLYIYISVVSTVVFASRVSVFFFLFYKKKLNLGPCCCLRIAKN